MVEQTLGILEQYELEIVNVRKGRGNYIVNCKNGDFVLKEYYGSEEKANLQKELTDHIGNATDVVVQRFVENKEGGLFSQDRDGTNFALQTYMEGRECDLKDEKECHLAIRTMAKMHKGMYITSEKISQNVTPYSLKREFEKRNTELRRIRRYLREKRNKNEFERFLYGNFNMFFEKGLEVEEAWDVYDQYSQPKDSEFTFCHGDYQHHNVWMTSEQLMVLQFEKYLSDLPCRDLYLFMRKLLEKNNWDKEVGLNVLVEYEKERPLPIIERISMIYRFAYPEKFWKIANYYFNSKKSFMPEKNMEKLGKLLIQEEQKEIFIGDILKKVL